MVHRFWSVGHLIANFLVAIRDRVSATGGPVTVRSCRDAAVRCAAARPSAHACYQRTSSELPTGNPGTQRLATTSTTSTTKKAIIRAMEKPSPSSTARMRSSPARSVSTGSVGSDRSHCQAKPVNDVSTSQHHRHCRDNTSQWFPPPCPLIAADGAVLPRCAGGTECRPISSSWNAACLFRGWRLLACSRMRV
jgi:hypothetical protein